MKNLYLHIAYTVLFVVGVALTAGWWWIVGALALYLFIGLMLSRIAAPMSWDNLIKNFGWVNIPFWVFLWPWPVSAAIYQAVTGNYPHWGPLL